MSAVPELSWKEYHKHTASCPSSVHENYGWYSEFDHFYKFRLPRGWKAKDFVGPYMQRGKFFPEVERLTS